MRTLISALAVAFAFAIPAYAGDVTTDPDKAAAKPGRQIEDSVKAEGGDISKQGRKLSEDVKVNKKATTKKHGRAIDGSKKAKKAAVEEKQGRALADVKTDDSADASKKQGRAVEENVKSGKEDTSKQGRAVQK